MYYSNGTDLGSHYCPRCKFSTPHIAWFSYGQCKGCFSNNYRAYDYKNPSAASLVSQYRPSTRSSSSSNNDVATGMGALLGAAVVGGAMWLGSRCQAEGCWQKKERGSHYCSNHS